MSHLTERDVLAIRSVVLLRLLSYGQLHRLAFPNIDPSTVRRRIRHLKRAGWLATWEVPSPRGGHLKYVHPTAEAIRRFLPALTADGAWAPLLELVRPRSARRPIQLGATIPKWLAHQREVNHLVVSILTAPERRVRFASSWECPFPSHEGILSLPQPDYILVEEVEGEPHVVFGEHDRGIEPVSRFIERKVKLYSALAVFPEVAEKLFGLRSFRVHVTVIDPLRLRPIARLSSLLDATRSAERPDIFRFALGGWLFAAPSSPIWFSPGSPPASDSRAWSDHASMLTTG